MAAQVLFEAFVQIAVDAQKTGPAQAHRLVAVSDQASALLSGGVPFSVPIALVEFPRLGCLGVSGLVALRTLRSVGAF